MSKESPLPAFYERYSAYEAADIVLAEEEKRKPRPSLEKFEDIKGEEQIKKDKEKIAAIAERIRKEQEKEEPVIQRKNFQQKKISDAFEVVILIHGEESEWFGPNALAVRTTEYDDVIHGVDAIIEFNQPHTETGAPQKPSRLALAIDATTDQTPIDVERKIKNNIEKILGMKGKSAKIEYFESQLTNERGRLDYIIPAVIGLEQKHAKEILADHANLITFQTLSAHDKEKYKESLRALRKKIETHPAQRIFLTEIETQLNLYEKILAKRTDNRSNTYKEEIAKLQRIINDVNEGKKEIAFDELKEDAVFQIIEQSSKDIKKDYI